MLLRGGWRARRGREVAGCGESVGSIPAGLSLSKTVGVIGRDCIVGVGVVRSGAVRGGCLLLVTLFLLDITLRLTGDTYTVDSVCLFLLLLPHLNKQLQVLIVTLCVFEGIQRLHEHLPNIAVLPRPEQLLGGINKLLIQVSSKCGTGIVGEDPYKHDGVVLQRGFGPVVAVYVFPDQAGAFCGGSRRRLGRLDDRW